MLNLKLKYIKEYNQFKDDEDIWNDFLYHYNMVKNENESSVSYIGIPDQREIEKDEICEDYINKKLLIEFWRKLPINIGGYILDKKEALNLINELYTYYHTADGILGISEWVDTYEKYKKEGGELYRLVFLKDPSDLNMDKLGNHWTYEKYVIDDYYIDYMYQFYEEHTVDKDPYVLTVKIPSGLNLKMGAFDRPEEKEIYISDKDQSRIQLIKVDKVFN